MASFKINTSNVMEAVYSYPFPEVRDLLDKRTLPSTFMLNTLPVETARNYLSDYSFNPELELPSINGTLNLDELHIPVIKRIKKQLRPLLPNIETFSYSYPTAGSSHAMYTLMAEWKAKGEMSSLAVLENEYEGYAAYATSLNIPIKTYATLIGHAPKAGEIWFISNPSAIDGNFIDKTIWQNFIQAGHQIVYDAAYIGLVTSGSIDVSAPNIRAVLTSPSKVFGVFRYRNTGICFTRDPISALYGTKWFKDIPALLDTLLLYETFTAYELGQRYQHVQQYICRALSETAGAIVKPSDTLLLGYTHQQPIPEFEKFKRGSVYRFGLTKLFEDYEFSLKEYRQ